MIVRKLKAEKLLRKSLRGPKYIGKKWFLLSRSRPHRNLGGFTTKEEAKKHERAIQYFKRNPKGFFAKEHDWNEILIEHEGRKLSRRQIRDYYIKIRNKIWPFLRNQTIMVIFAPSKNIFIRRRNDATGKYIKLTELEGIDNPNSYEYWINRRVIEFHPILMSNKSPILWIDLDMHKTKSKEKRKQLMREMKRAIPKLKKILKKIGVRKIYSYDSGTDGGIHLEGNLFKPMPVDSTRKKFKKLLDEAFYGDEIFTTGIARSGQIRLDITTYHYLGSLRAPYSMTITGGTKHPI